MDVFDFGPSDTKAWRWCVKCTRIGGELEKREEMVQGHGQCLHNSWWCKAIGVIVQTNRVVQVKFDALFVDNVSCAWLSGHKNPFCQCQSYQRRRSWTNPVPGSQRVGWS